MLNVKCEFQKDGWLIFPFLLWSAFLLTVLLKSGARGSEGFWFLYLSACAPTQCHCAEGTWGLVLYYTPTKIGFVKDRGSMIYNLCLYFYAFVLVRLVLHPGLAPSMGHGTQPHATRYHTMYTTYNFTLLHWPVACYITSVITWITHRSARFRFHFPPICFCFELRLRHLQLLRPHFPSLSHGRRPCCIDVQVYIPALRDV